MSEKKQPANGKSASKPSGPRSATKKPKPSELERLLAAVYDRLQKLDDREANNRARRNFVFHLTDCSEDILRLADLYQHPEKFDKATAVQAVSGLLYHALPHLLAAGRLGLDRTPEDIFVEVDQTSG